MDGTKYHLSNIQCVIIAFVALPAGLACIMTDQSGLVTGLITGGAIFGGYAMALFLDALAEKMQARHPKEMSRED